MRSYISYFLLIIALLLFRCSIDLAGGPGSGSETTNSLTITVVYPDGHPAYGAVVKLRSSEFLYNPDDETDSSRGIDALTDSLGIVKLDSIKSGKYAIEVNDQKGNAALINCSFSSKSTDSILPKKVLEKTSDIVGSVSSGSGLNSILVQIYGLERIAEVDSVTGQFVLRDIPEGSYTLKISDLENPTNFAIINDFYNSEKPHDPVRVNFTWPYVQNIILNTTENGASVDETVTDFPVAIKLNSTNFDFRSTPAVPKVRFTNEHGDTLFCQVELWDSVAQTAIIWVKTDTIRGNGLTTIVMLAGDNDAIDISKSKAVFDTGNGFQAVWHFHGSYETIVADATANFYNGTPHDVIVVDGVLGHGYSFDGSSYIEILNSYNGPLNFAEDDTFTISAWVNTDMQDTFYQDIVSKSNYQYGLQVNKNSQWNFFTYKSRAGWAIVESPAIVNSWVFVAGVSNGSSQYLYVNGLLEDSTKTMQADELLANTYYNVMIGRRSDVSERWFNGLMDEVCISNRARSKSWIKLCYQNQRIDQKLVQINR